MIKILLCFLVLNVGFVQAKTYRTELRVIAPFPTTKETVKPWNGHFSAQNFKKNASDQRELRLTKRLVQTSLFQLPSQHLTGLNKVDIRNQRHKSRGLAHKDKIVLNTASIDTYKELTAVLVHEMGHIVDLQVLEGRSRFKSRFKDGNRTIYKDDASVDFYRISWANSQQKRYNSVRSDFVSGYAQQDPFEDFAESYLMYRLHGDKFRALKRKSQALREKYTFMRDRVFQGQEFQTEKENNYAFINRHFDNTLLPFEGSDLAQK